MTLITVREHVVLVEDDQARLTVTRVVWWQRVGARLGGFWLDHALAAGTPPERSALLALRAEALVAEPFRDRLASQLVDIVLRLGTTTSRRSPTVTPSARAVRANHAGLLDLAKRLRDPSSVSAQGVARVALLLTDGAGPLFNPVATSDLMEAVRWARDGLEPASP